MSNTLQWVPQLRVGDLVRGPFAGVPVAVIDPYDIAAVAAAALPRTGTKAAFTPCPARSPCGPPIGRASWVRCSAAT